MSKEKLDRFEIGVILHDENFVAQGTVREIPEMVGAPHLPSRMILASHERENGAWADASQALRIIERLRKKAKRAKAEMLEAQDEVQRLTDLIANPNLLGMNVAPGSLDIGLEGIGPRILAETFANDFRRSGAENYLEVRLTSTDPAIGELMVTLQRVKGKTPSTLRIEAERELAQAKPAIIFAGHMLRAHRNNGCPGDVDGAFAQEAAVRAGLIVGREVTEPCGPTCECESVANFAEAPVTCFFTTEVGKAAIAAAGPEA